MVLKNEPALTGSLCGKVAPINAVYRKRMFVEGC
jgi:hypothetical protein